MNSNQQNYITVYLAGPCANEPDEGKEWRKEAVAAFRKMDKYDGLKACVIDPTDYFSYADPVHKTDKQVKNFYMSRLKDCDVILVNLRNTKTSPGTAMEVQFAVDHNIAVIGFDAAESYPWISNVDCDVVFNTLEEAIIYIKNYYIKSTLLTVNT